MDRREFLQLMGAASAGAVLAKSGALRSMGLSRSGDSTSTFTAQPQHVDPADRGGQGEYAYNNVGPAVWPGRHLVPHGRL